MFYTGFVFEDGNFVAVEQTYERGNYIEVFEGRECENSLGNLSADATEDEFRAFVSGYRIGLHRGKKQGEANARDAVARAIGIDPSIVRRLEIIEKHLGV